MAENNAALEEAMKDAQRTADTLLTMFGSAKKAMDNSMGMAKPTPTPEELLRVQKEEEKRKEKIAQREKLRRQRLDRVQGETDKVSKEKQKHNAGAFCSLFLKHPELMPTHSGSLPERLLSKQHTQELLTKLEKSGIEVDRSKFKL